jgi:hypothetical protein
MPRLLASVPSFDWSVKVLVVLHAASSSGSSMSAEIASRLFMVVLLGSMLFP